MEVTRTLSPVPFSVSIAGKQIQLAKDSSREAQRQERVIAANWSNVHQHRKYNQQSRFNSKVLVTIKASHVSFPNFSVGYNCQRPSQLPREAVLAASKAAVKAHNGVCQLAIVPRMNGVRW